MLTVVVVPFSVYSPLAFAVTSPDVIAPLH
jgi:hypothetical protein